MRSGRVSHAAGPGRAAAAPRVLRRPTRWQFREPRSTAWHLVILLPGPGVSAPQPARKRGLRTESAEYVIMLRHPIPVQRAPLPWLVRTHRQGFAGLWRLGGKLWPKLSASVAGAPLTRPH